MSELAGKTALITGAAQGIGAATAKALASAGVEVAGVDIQPVATWQSRAVISHPMCYDVSDDAEVGKLFEHVSQIVQGLDFVINAAGVLSESSISTMRVSEFDKIISVNLRGTFLVAQGAARIMQRQRSGRIIFIASELAYLGRPDFSAYCASKAGVVGLTRALARELAPDITVNCVAPGPIDTPMLSTKAMSQEWLQRESDNPLQRIGNPEEVAGLLRFMCGPNAGFFTGQTISPNGGAVMI